MIKTTITAFARNNMKLDKYEEHSLTHNVEQLPNPLFTGHSSVIDRVIDDFALSKHPNDTFIP